MIVLLDWGGVLMASGTQANKIPLRPHPCFWYHHPSFSISYYHPSSSSSRRPSWRRGTIGSYDSRQDGGRRCVVVNRSPWFLPLVSVVSPRGPSVPPRSRQSITAPPYMRAITVFFPARAPASPPMHLLAYSVHDKRFANPLRTLKNLKYRTLQY